MTIGLILFIIAVVIIWCWCFHLGRQYERKQFVKIGKPRSSTQDVIMRGRR